MDNNTSTNDNMNFDINALLKSGFGLNSSEDENLEILKLTKDDSHIYKMPPMSSSEGHTTDEFKDLIFRGKMKMFVKGPFVIIYFLNENNTVFLVSFVDENIEKYVTRARDSTRYFSLRAMNDKGEAGYYGLGNKIIFIHLVFKQRNDAFDFYTTLCDFKEKLQFEKKNKSEEYKPKYDFSMKTEKPAENEKKPVNLNR